jgi:hypothetical protein
VDWVHLKYLVPKWIQIEDPVNEGAVGAGVCERELLGSRPEEQHVR